MKLGALQVESLLSFDRFDLSFDDELTVLVGPNGSGKTNVIRVLDLVVTALDWADGRWTEGAAATAAQFVLDSYTDARHHRSPPDQLAKVRLDVELTSSEERDLMTAFMRAALLSSLLGELSGREPPPEVAHWAETVTEAELRSLYSGTIVLEHSGVAHAQWDISYEFRHDGASYRWVVAGAPAWGGVIRADTQLHGTATVVQERLLPLLFGSGVTSTSPPSLPSPLPPFQFDTLCAAAGKVVPLTVQTGTTFGLDHEPYRRFTQLARIPTWPTSENRAYSLARVLRLLLNDGLVIVGEQFRGIGVGGAPARPASFYAWEELIAAAPRRELHSLPLRLFSLKNGDQAARENFERVRGTFAVLAPGRSLDIRFEATAGQATTHRSEGDAQPLPLISAADIRSPDSVAAASSSPGAAVTVLILDERAGELPIAQVGAGTWEALVLAEAITISENRTTILDEPALNLHPTWQHVLRAQLRRTPGQLVLVTHSADLVPTSDQADLGRIVRLENEAGATRPHRLPPSLDTKSAARIARVFTLSADARALLFARAAVVVEGETELGALPGWFAQAARQSDLMTPEDLDLGFYCVGGDAHFQPVITVLHWLGIPWAAVCDGVVLDVVKARRRHIFRQVCDAGVNEPQLASFLDTHVTDHDTEMTHELFKEQKQLGREHCVFTLARGWTTKNRKTGEPGDESFEVFVEHVAPGKLDEAESAVGMSSVRKGRWLAENVAFPEEVGDLYVRIVNALDQHASGC